MTSDDAGGLTVDLKLFKQLIKKNEPNRLQIAINALCESGPGEKLPCLVSERMPARVSL